MIKTSKGKTKDRILSAALRLFNEEGSSKVNARHIASEMGISYGNLCYHYPRKEDMIIALYEQMMGEMDEVVLSIQDTGNILEVMLRAPALTGRIAYKYKFLTLDSVSIQRDIASIRKQHNTMVEERLSTFRLLFDALISAGIMREEMLPGQYELFIRQAHTINSYWMVQAELSASKLSRKQKIQNYADAINGMLVPYLTPEGLTEYRRIIYEIGN